MSFFEDPPLRDFPDHAMRRLLEEPANLRDLVSAVLPDLVAALDFTRVQYEAREFLMQDWRKRECDLFVSIGTSGAVYPAAGFVQTAKYVGAATREINLEPSQGSKLFDERRFGLAGVEMPRWVGELLA